MGSRQIKVVVKSARSGIEYIPFISMFSPMETLFKEVEVREVRGLNTRTISVINYKEEGWRKAVAMIPVIGNIIVGIYDAVTGNEHAQLLKNRSDKLTTDYNKLFELADSLKPSASQSGVARKKEFNDLLTANKNNPEFLELISGKVPVEHLSDELKNDKEFIKKCAIKDLANIQHLNSELKKDESVVRSFMTGIKCKLRDEVENEYLQSNNLKSLLYDDLSELKAARDKCRGWLTNSFPEKLYDQEKSKLKSLENNLEAKYQKINKEIKDIKSRDSVLANNEGFLLFSTAGKPVFLQ